MGPGPALIMTLALALLSLGCGVKAPTIEAVEWRIELQQGTQGPHEALSVFARVHDEAGSDDVEELWVSQDQERLAWKLDSGTWVKRMEGSDTWFGAPGLSRPDLAPLPRGDYRITAIDAAGDRAEKTVQIVGSFPALPPPSLVLRGGQISSHGGDWPELLLLAFDASGTLLASKSAPPKSSTLSELFGSDIAAKTRELAAYGYDPATHSGYYTTRIAVK
ncbi:MAG TPA: hypothetical protein VMC79_05395 [Rectinemataceae bacterium]|nr:hypothetical protein [Rectinemataceae bacterium]